MTDNLLQLAVGSSRKKVTITGIESKRYAPEDKDDRVYIDTIAVNGKTYKVSEIWIKNYKQEVIPRGLWLNMDDSNQALDATSPLVQLLQYLGAVTLADLIGKEVYVEPKPNGFMAIISYDE
jgi:hypothetical protein